MGGGCKILLLKGTSSRDCITFPPLSNLAPLQAHFVSDTEPLFCLLDVAPQPETCFGALREKGPSHPPPQPAGRLQAHFVMPDF